jgi:hypothetical protein
MTWTAAPSIPAEMVDFHVFGYRATQQHPNCPMYGCKSVAPQADRVARTGVCPRPLPAVITQDDPVEDDLSLHRLGFDLLTTWAE